MNLKNLIFVFVTFFTVGYCEWSSPPTPLPSGTGSSTPQVGENITGKAVSIWLKNSGGPTPLTIEASVWDGLTWGGPDTISAATTDFNLLSPRIAVPRLAPLLGNTAFAVWVRNDGSGFVVQSSRLVSGSWTAVEELSLTGGNANAPQISSNLTGSTAVAIWNRRNGGKNVIQARVWNGTMWEPVTDLSDGTQDAGNPQVSVNAQGNAVAVWQWFDGVRFIIRSRVWNGSEWLPVQNISLSGLSVDAIFPQVGLNAAGNAVAVWAIGTGDSFIVEGSTYDGTSWTDPVEVSDAGENVSGPQLGVDAFGNAVASWQAKGTFFPVKASVWNGSVWSSPELISENGKNTDVQQLSVNAEGNAMVVWEIVTDEGRVIQASFWNQYLWSDPVVISAAGATFNLNPQVSLNALNNAVAVWSDDDGIIQSSFNTNLIPEGPTNFSGFSEKNKFLTQTDIINRLSWEPSVDPDVTSYRIYQGRKLVAEVPATGPFEVTLHNRTKGPNSYALMSFDNSRLHSIPVFLTVE